MAGAKHSPIFGELSDFECEDCGDLIPTKRIQAVQTTVCIGCAEDREQNGTGVKRHRMDYHVKTHGDDIESIDTFIVREEKEG